MGNPRALINLSAALVLSLLTGYLVLNWVQNTVTKQASRPVEVQAPGPRRIAIAVASAALPRGAKLDDKQVKLVPYFEESLPEGNFTDPALLKDRLLAQPVASGEPILESKLVALDAATGGVSALIKPGKRAIAVKGNKVLGLGGFIKPGNLIDVLVSLEEPTGPQAEGNPEAAPAQARKVTKLVLEQVLVLATGTELAKKQDGDDLASVETYTLEVTPQEAEILALASTHGTLHFALRNPADVDTVLTKGADIKAALASFSSAGGVTAPGQPKPAAVIEAIRGGKVEKISF